MLDTYTTNKLSLGSAQRFVILAKQNKNYQNGRFFFECVATDKKSALKKFINQTGIDLNKAQIKIICDEKKNNSWQVDNKDSKLTIASKLGQTLTINTCFDFH